MFLGGSSLGGGFGGGGGGFGGGGASGGGVVSAGGCCEYKGESQKLNVLKTEEPTPYKEKLLRLALPSSSPRLKLGVSEILLS